MEHEAYLSKETGKIYWHSEFGDNFEELPDDIDDSNKYISIPHKNDLDLGNRLAFRFVEKSLPSESGRVRTIFARRGAYARFKGFLVDRGMLKQWHEFEAEAQEKALREWCKANDLETDG